jgi:prevent-host-death family protein
LDTQKPTRKVPIEHLNIAEFNRGQSSKLVKDLVAEDKVAFIQKHGKPMVVVISYERYKRLLEQEVDINEY